MNQSKVIEEFRTCTFENVKKLKALFTTEVCDFLQKTGLLQSTIKDLTEGLVIGSSEDEAEEETAEERLFEEKYGDEFMLVMSGFERCAALMSMIDYKSIFSKGLLSQDRELRIEELRTLDITTICGQESTLLDFLKTHNFDISHEEL